MGGWEENLERLTRKLPGRLVIGSGRRIIHNRKETQMRDRTSKGKTRQDKTRQYLLKQEYGIKNA